MSGCDQARARQADYLDGMLPADARRAVEAHLAHCSHCHSDFAAAGRLEGDLLALGRCADRIAAAPIAARSPRLPAWSRTLLRVAAVVGLMAGGWLATHSWNSSRPKGPAGPGDVPIVALDPLADAVRAARRDDGAIVVDGNGVALRLRSDNPRVQIVLFVGDTNPPPDTSRPVADDGPETHA
ncbi:MAG: zf-HC2 domain-containing protein [Phycisphaerae bacterium]